MAKDNEILLPAIRLEYEKGELIAKEGDYGISIYQVVEGKVEIFIKSDGEEVSITTLGPGEIIGEMIFLTGNKTRRSASIRAVEDSVLEAWHPSRVLKEYEEIPFAIRYIANQVVKHLIHTDQKITEFSKKKEKDKKPAKTLSPKDYKKRTYRKDVHFDCLYRPVESSKDLRLWGRIKNISKTGLRLDIMRMNALDNPHEFGSEFQATAFLPNDRQVKIRMLVANLRKTEEQRTLTLGMKFVDVSKEVESILGFLLLGK